MDGNTTPQRDQTDPGAARPAPLAFVVDDDAATLALLCDIAEDCGWTARGFTRLGETTANLRHEHPDLLILDDDLPDGSGGEMARRIRQDPRLQDVVVLVCTAAHPMRQAEIGSWAPVVSKPFDIADLERFLDAAARRHYRAEQHSAAG